MWDYKNLKSVKSESRIDRTHEQYVERFLQRLMLVYCWLHVEASCLWRSDWAEVGGLLCWFVLKAAFWEPCCAAKVMRDRVRLSARTRGKELSFTSECSSARATSSCRRFCAVRRLCFWRRASAKTKKGGMTSLQLEEKSSNQETAAQKIIFQITKRVCADEEPVAIGWTVG